MLLTFAITGCGELSYDMAYKADADSSTFNVVSKLNSQVATSFAWNLGVVNENILPDSVDMSQATAAVLVDVNNSEFLFAKNPHERLYPASLTKVMTALVALKYGTEDQVLTATNSVVVNESGAQLCGVKAGDTMTLNQALHILLMYSANDVALMIAENIGGTVDGFIELMNEEARAIGATNTNFVNPHGLSDDSHFTTAYDLYLIFNEAIKYSKFTEIIQMTNYQTTYYDQNNTPKEVSFQTTNLFLRGIYNAPESITVIGGKTGTTNAAGHCLVIFSKDSNGAPYISVILRSESRDVLYAEMADLLDEIMN